MAGDLCDMCQAEPYTVSNIIRENGETSWFCWYCLPYAMAKMLAEQGWSVEPPAAPAAEPVDPDAEDAAAGEKPRRRPRVVKAEEAPSPGPADPAGLEAPAAAADDQRGDGGLEPGSGARAEPGTASPGA